MASKIQKFTTLTALNGYKPSQSVGGPDADPNSIYRGYDFWIRAGGILKPCRGTLPISANETGPRIWPLDIYRGSFRGGTLLNRPPKRQALVRYQKSALFYLSEDPSVQVIINESTTTPFNLTGVVTSPIPGKMRVAIQNGTSFTQYEAGFDAPVSIGVAAAQPGGVKGMTGRVSVRIAAKRMATETVSNPTAASVFDLDAAGNNRIRVALPTMVTGQDAWVFGGTFWNLGDYGPWYVIRESKTNLIVTAFNGSGVVTVNGDDNASTSLQPGDLIVIAGDLSYVSNVNPPTSTTFNLASDPAGNVPKVWPGGDGTYTCTLLEAVLDWRDGEIGGPNGDSIMEFDNDAPPILDGVMLFNNIPFGWQGNQIFPSKVGNPEAYPIARRRMTQSGSDIVNILAGNARIYVMTTSGLEIVIFTQVDSDPYFLKQIWGFGFSSPTQGVVADGVFYGAVGTPTGVKVIRTREDQSPDLTFSQPVESDMLGWNINNVVMAINPREGAVLAIHNDGTNTTIIPYMLQDGFWSIPQRISGQVVSAATVQNNCELSVFTGIQGLVYRHENGDGNIARIAVWPFLDLPTDTLRKTIKRLQIVSTALVLGLKVIKPGQNIPDPIFGVPEFALTTTSTAVASNNVAFLNAQQAALYQVAVGSFGPGTEISEINLFGIINDIWR